MAIGQASGLCLGFKSAWAKFKKYPVQLTLAIFLVMCCGLTKKFQTFPMVWIAGQSKCRKEVTALPMGSNGGAFTAGGQHYEPVKWIQTLPNCTESAEVFVFVRESFTITTANLVFFGIVKACFNFVTGAAADALGRKWTFVIGWVLAIPMPFMVIFAENWWTVATSNIFLGMQQALVWSTTIFVMVDYFGQENSGLAIGLNETIGYTTIAIATEIAAAIMDVNRPRTTCYYVVIAIIFSNIIVGILCLKESKPLATKEEAFLTARSEEEVVNEKHVTFTWPSQRSARIPVAQSAFLYTTFVNRSSTMICFAGLMINFISGFSWGLFKKWMKGGHESAGEVLWEPFDKKTVADIVLCYGLPKGILQWIFGFLGDRIGRKYLIVAGLSIAAAGLIVVACVGVFTGTPEAGFFVGALMMGTGTGIMYTNNLAAICDHSDPTWRSSALGTYRFWRDLGYAAGALLTGAVADAVGVPWSVGVTALLTALAAMGVAVWYREVVPEADKVRSGEQKPNRARGAENGGPSDESPAAGGVGGAGAEAD